MANRALLSEPLFIYGLYCIEWHDILSSYIVYMVRRRMAFSEGVVASECSLKLVQFPHFVFSCKT